ncbi:MAG: sulfatase-like hydrolase/transferase [Rikenellaceae bacterium]
MKLQFNPLQLACLLPMAAVAQSTEQPNIILIMCDDLGWGDTGFNGNNTIQTPNLDALSKEGVKLNWFYSSSPVSSPTRASVMTGRNPYRMGIFTANAGILRPEERTIAEELKEIGYTAGHFGKWHLGSLSKTVKDANRGGAEHPELYNLPSEHGFDDSFVTESKVPTYDPMIKPKGGKGHFWDYVKANEESEVYGTAYWRHDGSMATDNLAGDDSRVIMDRVIPFIDNAVASDTPFFSTVWFHAPHLPCVAGAEHAAIYKDYPLNERNYYGCITAMDEQVGRLVRYLKNLGVFENTVIMFCSDNGPERNTPGTAAHLKERKRSLHEGGVRVPAFAVWSGKIAKGSSLNSAMVTSDYFPTIMEIVGKEFTHTVDGESILPILMGESDERSNPIVFCHNDKQGAIVDGDYKLYYRKGNYELYNIKQDPGEQNDISAQSIDIAKSLEAKMKQTYKEFKASFDGKEYGTESYKRLNQKWDDVLEN